MKTHGSEASIATGLEAFAAPAPQARRQEDAATPHDGGVGSHSPRGLATLRLLTSLSLRALFDRPLAFCLMVAAVAVGTAFQIPNAANLAGYERELLLRGVSQSRGEVVLSPKKGAYLE